MWQGEQLKMVLRISFKVLGIQNSFISENNVKLGPVRKWISFSNDDAEEVGIC